MRRLLTLCCLLMIATPAFALENENLLVRLPDGYKQGFSDRKDNMVINEFVPDGQTVEDWTEMVTVQIFFGMKGVTPAQFRARIEQLWSKACADASSHSIASAVEKGYATVVWMMNCPRNAQTGKLEITWFKALQGNDSFYVVQKAFKFDPPKEQIVQWTLWLKGVALCDTRLPERACPAGIQ